MSIWKLISLPQNNLSKFNTSRRRIVTASDEFEILMQMQIAPRSILFGIVKWSVDWNFMAVNDDFKV